MADKVELMVWALFDNDIYCVIKLQTHFPVRKMSLGECVVVSDK